MNKKLTAPLVVIVLAGLVFAGREILGGPDPSESESPRSLASPAQAAEPAGSETGDGLIPSGPGFEELREALAAGKYAFLFFFQRDDAQTKKMRDVFDEAVTRVRGRAVPLFVDVNDPRSLPLIGRYGTGRAPMPLVLVVAPNGAITRGLPRDFSGEQIVDGIVSPCMETCLGSLQSRRLSIVCVATPGSAEAEGAMASIRELQADPQYASVVDVLSIDPNDPGEARTLKDLKVNVEPGGAITVVLAPPGKVLATLAGAVTKTDLVTALTSGLGGSGCAPGAGSGCCPKPAAKKG